MDNHRMLDVKRTIMKEAIRYFEDDNTQIRVGSRAEDRSEYVHLQAQVMNGTRVQAVTIPIKRDWFEQDRWMDIDAEVKIAMFIGLRGLEDTEENRKTYELLYEE